MLGRIRSHKLYIPLATIFGLAAIFLAYSAIYVSSQEAYANERAFRLLSVVGDQLTKHFDNLRSVMAAALVYAASEDGNRGASDKAAGYIKRVAGQGTQISVLKEDAHCPSTWKREGEVKFYLIPNQANFALRARFEAAEGQRECSIDAYVDPAAEFRRRFRDLTANYFDDILIATSTGEVLFESNPSGLRISSMETLISAQGSNAAVKPELDGKDAKAKASHFREISQFSNVRDVRFAGGVYKLYVQPVSLQVFGDEKEKQTVKTVICGLWRTDRQQLDVVSIPYDTLIWGVLGVLAVFGLLWPLLKVAYMSPTERLKRPHVFYLISSALFVAAILTTLAMNGAYLSRLEGDARRQLDSLAERIDQNVKIELARALTLMNRLECPACEARALLASAGRSKWTRARILEESAVQKFIHIYPYFDNIFWADRKGKQLFKVSVRGEATPQTPVAGAAYFRAARDGQRLTSLVDHRPAEPQGANSAPEYDETALRTKFRMQTLYSPNTGEYVAVLAKPVLPGGLPPYFADAAVQVLVTKLVSLQEPVLPAGFGYAILDRDGLVQFHSSEGRNQIENFFQESGQNPVIRAMVSAGTSGFVNVAYSGRQRLMRVWPLPYLADPGLTLVVFRDTNYFRTINMACMLTFGLLATMFGLPVFAALAAYIARCGSYPLERLWPDGAGRAGYLRIVAAAVCIGAAFLIRYPKMEIDGALHSVLALFGAGMLLAAVACRRPRWSEVIYVAVVTSAIMVIAGVSAPLLLAGVYLALSVDPARRHLSNLAARCSPRSLYVAAVFSLLVAGVVLPCFGLFKIAYQSISRLALATALQDRFDLLAHRADAIRDHFADLQKIAGETGESCGANLNSIVAKRIRESLDRYDRPVFAPRHTKLTDDKVTAHISAVEKRIASVAALFPNNTFGGQLRQATLADEGDGHSPWKIGVVNGYEVVELKQAPEGLRELSLRGAYPIWRVGREHILSIALLAAVLIVWLGYMVRKLFLADLAQAPHLERWAGDGIPDSNLLVIGHPKSGRSTAAAQIAAKDWIDLAQVVPSGDWTIPELKENVVVVDNFEFDMENPASWHAKLKLLEDLVFVRNKRVILLSTVDPIFYSEGISPELQTSGQVLHRWAAVMSNFEQCETDNSSLNPIGAYVDEQARQGRVVPAELIALLREECDGSPHLRKVGLGMLARHAPGSTVSRARFIGDLMDRADAFYRVLWSACTNQERLVLFQLARDGWANPKNARAIQQLERRGLVRRTPALRILNESFCRFVKNARLPGEVAKWEQEVQTSTWTALKLGFTTAALAGGGWLLYTQQEIFHASLGYVAAMGTASGAVISLVRSVSQVKAGGSADKTTNA